MTHRIEWSSFGSNLKVKFNIFNGEPKVALVSGTQQMKKKILQTLLIFEPTETAIDESISNEYSFDWRCRCLAHYASSRPRAGCRHISYIAVSNLTFPNAKWDEATFTNRRPTQTHTYNLHIKFLRFDFRSDVRCNRTHVPKAHICKIAAITWAVQVLFSDLHIVKRNLSLIFIIFYFILYSLDLNIVVSPSFAHSDGEAIKFRSTYYMCSYHLEIYVFVCLCAWAFLAALRMDFWAAFVVGQNFSFINSHKRINVFI